MTRQLRNKRKKSPSVDTEDSATLPESTLESRDEANDNVLSGDSDTDLIVVEAPSRQTRGRRSVRTIGSDVSEEEGSNQVTQHAVVGHTQIDENAGTNARLVESSLGDDIKNIVEDVVEAPCMSEVAQEEGDEQQGGGVPGIGMVTPRPEASDVRGEPPTQGELPSDKDKERPPPSEEVIRSVDDIRNNLEIGIKALGTLEEVYTCSNTGRATVATLLPSVDLRYEVNDITALRRIYTLATLKGNVRLHNLGLAKPQDYSFVEKEKYIRRKTPPGVAEFFMLGTVTLSKLLGGERDKNRQLCLRPMWELFGRSQAFIGAMLKKKGYYLSTFRNGVSFSSLFPQKSTENSRTYPTRSRYSNTVLPFTPSGVDVPIYDGTVNPFTLSTYNKLDRSSVELEENSVVMVTFTVGAYALPADKVPLDAMPGLDTRVSFNIKDVVVIAPSTVDFREKLPTGEETWGVERSRASWQTEGDVGGVITGTQDVLEPEI